MISFIVGVITIPLQMIYGFIIDPVNRWYRSNFARIK